MSWQKSLGKGVRELRFVFCQQNQQSAGLRNFVASSYLSVKKENPDFPFIVRECEGADPYLIARYRFGVEKKAYLGNLTQQEINSIVDNLASQADAVNSQIQK